MENFVDLLVSLAQLSITIIILALLFIFVVRPLLKHLSVNHEIEHRKRPGDALQNVEPDPDLLASHHDDIIFGDTVHRPRSSKKEMLDRLAASDPEKAGNLIKKWLNEG